MSNLDAISMEDLIDRYEDVREQRGPERTKLYTKLAWRIFTETDSPHGTGITHGGVTYSLDINDELCRHIVTRRKFQRLPEVAKVYRVTL
jgi:hypothetical protein